MIKWQVLMTDTAKQDLREIALNIYEQSEDLDTAVSFVTAHQEQSLALESYPERGAVPKDYVLKALGYRYLVYKHYLTFYLMDDSEHKVYLHTFFNEKQDYFHYMRKRI